MQVVSYYAEDGVFVVDGDFGELAELGADFFEARVVVYRKRDAGLGGGGHVDRRVVALEHFEDAAQESGGRQAASGADGDDGDAFLGGHGLGHAARVNFVFYFCDYFCSGGFGIAGVQDPDGNVFLLGWRDRGGVQDFGSEARQFGGFVEGHHGNAAGFRAEARIGGHDAVDIGPDFDAAGVESGANDGSAVIGATTTERGGHAVASGSEKAAQHRDSALLDQRAHQVL